MHLNRVGTGAKIAAASAIALLLVMFVLPWFGLDEESATSQGEEFQQGASQEELEEAFTEVGDAFANIGEDETSVGFNAFESFGLIDIVLLIAILLTLGLVAAQASGTRIELPVAGSALIAGLGAIGVLLVLFRIIVPPGISFLDYGREFGVFVGLLATAGIAYGGYRAMQDEGTSLSADADRPQSRGSGEPPPPPPPPPPPEAPTR